MTADPQCIALGAAMSKKGWSYAQLATKIGTTEQRVIDICTGSQRPTEPEFKALGIALDIQDVARIGNHSTA